ncbi:ATP-binding cassette domain-containing protein, partial [Paenibacillus sp. 598K]|uniref:ATP-binding cassette domain-containing protein n=1 Tax=Paenibacillus sp. 598K TaxID=1117987 RepID=UPI0021A9F9FC
MAIYRIRELSFTFPDQSLPALSGIDLNLMTGQFAVLCGRSGSGKSTLLRQLKPALAPHGERSGEILYAGAPLASLETRRQAAEIGFVLQHADNSVVTDKVWHELAFGLESLGEDQQTIRLRVAEMASFFGIQSWFHRSVSELSGGQRQLLQLASIMAMQPQVLLLDEPTSQLDPIAALDFLNTLTRINRELGTTILLSEHRLEEALPLADRLLVMDAGRLVADGAPLEAAAELLRLQHPMFQAMPSAIRIHAGTASRLPAPLTVRDGRSWLYAHLAEEQSTSDIAATATTHGGPAQSDSPASATRPSGSTTSGAPASATAPGGHRQAGLAAVNTSPGRHPGGTAAVAAASDGLALGGAIPAADLAPGMGAAARTSPGQRAPGRSANAEPALRLRDVWYRYDKQGPDILRGFDLEVAQGEWCCILGGNGAGKSTALALAGGLPRP